ncbi:hypothetical protein PHYPSEUDO_007898 [Phytophthora pseudosyringae]|uniref:Uncharacterized protein n=1 Tax=Phytophthora pseudosyringae TaxID=221518 RepID=A0A8T1VKM6_9STRA|nr:hypothetical protein PHYPSEUDO_007898 [Phytophthora pseudosyringae]
MRLRCVLALWLWLAGDAGALRSCTKNGQVRVPCEDELLLGKADRFLLTLYGHSCYTMHVVSPQPLEVLFYDSRDLKSGQPAGRRLGEDATAQQGANETADSLAALGDSHACRNVLSCVQLQQGLSKATVYNLMIARWANASAENELDQGQEDARIRVRVELEHCDPVSPWHYVGLVFVGSIGFTSTMLLLCIVGEVVFGLRSITKLQKAAQQDPFVELAQMHTATQERGEESEEDPEEPTAPLMTTVIPSDAEPATESEEASPA